MKIVVCVKQVPDTETRVKIAPAGNAVSEADVANAFAAWLDDPASRSVLKSAVRDRAAVLIESVVDQVIAELEPLLRRHRDKNAAGAQ